MSSLDFNEALGYNNDISLGKSELNGYISQKSLKISKSFYSKNKEKYLTNVWKATISFIRLQHVENICYHQHVYSINFHHFNLKGLIKL